MKNNELLSMNFLLEEYPLEDVEVKNPNIIYQDLGPWGQDKGTEDFISNSRKRLEETSALTDKISNKQLQRRKLIECNSQLLGQNSPKTLKKESIAGDWFFKHPKDDESTLKETDFLRPRRLKSLHSSKPPRMNTQQEYPSHSLNGRSNTLATEVLEDLLSHPCYDICSISPADIELNDNIKIPNYQRLKTDFPEFQIKQSELFKKQFQMLLQVKPFNKFSGFSTPVAEISQKQFTIPLQPNTPRTQKRTPSRNLRCKQKTYQCSPLPENQGKILPNISSIQEKDRNQSNLKTRPRIVMSPIAYQIKQHDTYNTNNLDDSKCAPYNSRFPMIAIEARRIQPYSPLHKESKQDTISKRIAFCFSNRVNEESNHQSSIQSPKQKLKQQHLFLTPV